MPRFFVPEAAPGARFLVLRGENAAHARVLRVKAGERVTVCDAKGTDFQCTVSDVAPGQISLVVQHEEPSYAEPPVFCRVYMAFAKAEKLEHVIQKATELGAGEIINVGDSRAYLFTPDGVQLLTVDHSIVEFMVQRGEITQEQAKNHPGKNVITRAVGTEPSVEGDIYIQKLHRDDCLLLCSDGLSNVMADQEMLFEVAHGVRKSDCCQRLLRIAKNRGAPDNVTVAMALV